MAPIPSGPLVRAAVSMKSLVELNVSYNVIGEDDDDDRDDHDDNDDDDDQYDDDDYDDDDYVDDADVDIGVGMFIIIMAATIFVIITIIIYDHHYQVQSRHTVSPLIYPIPIVD
jgi:hypothetical protein